MIPVIEGLVSAGTRAQISIDTSKSTVAAQALEAGATYVNDVTAFRADPEIADVVARAGAECCVMHMLGDPRTMQDDPRYDDVVDDVKAFLEQRLEFAISRASTPTVSSIRASASARRSRTTSSCSGASTSSSRSAAARDRHVAQVVSRRTITGRESRRARRRDHRDERHRLERGASSSACTTLRRCTTRSRWRLLR